MRKWAFLWVTDLHYESPDSNFTDDPKELDKALDEKLRDEIFPDFHSLLEANFSAVAELEPSKKLSFIAIGGDITSHGRPAGFQRFLDEALPNLARLVDQPKAICIVPGNHDVQWGLDPTSTDYFGNKFKDFVKMVDTAKATSCLIPKGELRPARLHEDKNLKFDPPRNGPLYIDPDNHVLVLNLNSAIRCGELNRKMYFDLQKHLSPPSSSTLPALAAGAAGKTADLNTIPQSIRPFFLRDVAQVTQAQLHELKAKLKTAKEAAAENWDGYLRVALLHHHLTPFPGQNPEHKGYEATVDSAQILEFLVSHHFDIVLTGHKHQPYLMLHRFRGKDIHIIGGPTVGGFAPSENFRGFHLVKVESARHGRSVSILDIPCSVAKGDIDEDLKALTWKPAPTNGAHSRTLNATEVKKAGYSYRDIVSITRINEDGDALRVVECDDLVIHNQCSRATSHVLDLPQTSGYLDMLRARGKSDGLYIHIKKSIPDRQNTKRCTVELDFGAELPIGPAKPGNPSISYLYEWYAVNAFALDELQFIRKYGTNYANSPKIEFTDFIPADPTERLTVFVKFPRNFKLPVGFLPTLRISRVDKTRDSRDWTSDKESKEEATYLKEIHALRYFEPLNIAALRVRAPKVGLSYGIQWHLPEAPKTEAGATLTRLTTQLYNASDDTLKRIYRILAFSRESLLSEWDRDLDGTLMIFNMAETASMLKAVAAGYTSGTAAGDKSVQRMNEVVLEYGEGIAGRAFKVNRIRVYVDPSTEAGAQLPKASESRVEPNYYKQVPGTITHKALIAFPVHLPVVDKEFYDDFSIYERREPYGVLNIGSQSEDCPIGQLLLPARSQELLHFQHKVNKALADDYLRNRIST